MPLFEICSAPKPNEKAIGHLDYYNHELSLRRLCSELERREQTWMGRKLRLISRNQGHTHMGIAAYTLVQGLRKFRSRISKTDRFLHSQNIHNALSFVALVDLYDKTLWTPDKPNALDGVMEVVEEGLNDVGGIDCRLHVDPAVSNRYFGHSTLTESDPHHWYADETLFVQRGPSIPEPHAEVGMERLKTTQTLDSLDMLSPYLRFAGPVSDMV